VSTRRLRRIILIAAIGLMSVTLTAAPAWAAGNNEMHVRAPDITLAADGGPGKVYTFGVAAVGTVTGATLTFEFAGIADLATPSMPDQDLDCSLNGHTATCRLPDHHGTDWSAEQAVLVRLVPLAGATAGASGTIKATASATNVDDATASAPVTVKSGVDLVVLGKDASGDLGTANGTVGGDTHFTFEVTNDGSVSALGLTLTGVLSHGLSLGAGSPCSNSVAKNLVCRLPGERVDPGQHVTLSIPVHFDADATVDESVFATVDAAKAAGSGSATDIYRNDNAVHQTWDLDAIIDLKTVGATITGKPGDTVSVFIGVKNVGPAWIDHSTLGDNEFGVARAILTVPSWAKVVSMACELCAKDAKTGKWIIAGDRGTFMVGDEDLVKVTFKILAVHGTDGSIVLNTNWGAGTLDKRSANNVAAITLKSTGSELPATGSEAGMIALIGAGVLLLGGVLVAVGRRRA
jgi:LPXTG-motif cell wall-anchored protein/uncharacterized repeat protein (TIGR01451 family)